MATTKKAGARAATKLQSANADDAIEMLKNDHRTVEQLYAQFEKASGQQAAALAKKICDELIIHAEIEEKIFYPACRSKVDEDLLNEAEIEHDSLKVLIADLNGGGSGDKLQAKVKVLIEYVKHHVKEEEKTADGMFKQAKSAGLDTASLGQRMKELKERLKVQAESQGLPAPQPKHLKIESSTTSKEMSMARQRTPERDEYGRFMSDDDDDNYRRGSRSSGRYDEDDDDRSSRSYRGYSSGNGNSGRSSRSRDDDDDRGQDRGQGGWFGDSEGHARAAREGWRNRDDDRSSSSNSSGGRSSRDDDDYSNRSSSRSGSGSSGRSRYDDEDDRRSSRGRYGSQSSGRSRYEDDRDYRSGSSSRGGYNR